MYKLYCFLASKPAGSDAQHDPFVTSGAAARALVQSICPAACGYVQSRALQEQLDDAAPAYRGCGELYFANAADLLRAWEALDQLTPLWNSDAVTPVASMAGRNRVVIRLPEHHEQSSIKGVFPFKRLSTLSVADFQARWWHGHGPIAARTEAALYYPQCHPLPQCYDGAQRAPDFDGVTELHWPDFQQAQAAMQSEQMRIDQGNDAKHFAAPGSVALFFAREEIVIAP